MLPLFFSPNKNMTKEYIIEQQNILRRNAVIDEFLNSLDNKKNNSKESDNSEDKQINNDEKDEIDDFFRDVQYLKKIETHNKKRELIKNRPKCYGRKNKNKNNNNENELNMNKYSTLSFDNGLDSKMNNEIDKIITPRCATNNNIVDYMNRKNKKGKKLPKIDINNLKFRNIKTDNYFLTTCKPIFTRSECNIININDMVNNNFKWTNRKILKHINSVYSNSTSLNTYIYNLNQLRSKSHIGNRIENKNLKIMNSQINNISPNLIAAQLYKNNSFLNKRLKRNYTAKLNKNINTNTNKILSEKKEDKKNFNTLINNNINSSSPKNRILNKNVFRKFFNNTKNIELNWMNTVINNKNNFKIININKNELSKKQLKLKLAEIEVSHKIRNDGKLYEKTKK